MTRKRGYASKAAARKAARVMKERLRIYVCRHCGLWHMTKEPINRVIADAKRGYIKKAAHPRQEGKVPKTKRPRADLKKVEEALRKKEEAKR